MSHRKRVTMLARLQRLPIMALVAMLAFSPVSWGVENLLGEAETLVQAGKGTRAYPMLAPLEATHAGDPKFDRLLGLAALAAGEAGHATLALERVVIMEPENARGHYELARAYAALGDQPRARLEAEIALALKPSPPVEREARQMLAGMQAPTMLPKQGSGIYVELGLGYDSNVNSGIEAQTIYLPLFSTDAVLDPESRKQSASYGHIAAGGQYRTAIGANSVFSASLDTTTRRYSDLDEYNPLSALLRLGIGFNESRAPVRLTVLGQTYNMDGDRGYSLYGMVGEWLLPVSSRHSAQLYGRYTQLRYGDSVLETNDYNQGVIGAGWLYAITPRLLAGLSVHGGTEIEVNLRADGDSRFYGLRTTMQYTTRNYDVYGALGAQTSDYDRENALFEDTRADKLVEATLGLNYRLTAAWSLRPKLTYINQNSNIVVYDFSRYDVMLAVRYDFRF